MFENPEPTPEEIEAEEELEALEAGYREEVEAYEKIHGKGSWMAFLEKEFEKLEDLI